MIGRSALWAVVTGALLMPVPAVAGTVELKRADKWHLDYGEDTCTLATTFGEGDRAVFLKFVRANADEDFLLQAFGRPFVNDGASERIDVAFGPGGKANSRLALTGNAGKVAFADLGSNRLDNWPSSDSDSEPPVLTSQDEARVTEVVLGPIHGRSYRLVTGPMDVPMKAMGTCMDDLIRHWGYDPQVGHTLQRKPTHLTDPRFWLSPSDYPASMVFAGMSGVVQTRLDVDATGAVSGCHVRQVTKAEGFADLTCHLISRRARFQPARDAQGKPVPWFYVSTVRWLLK